MAKKTTANETVDAIDPGGTRPTKGKGAGKTPAGAAGGEPTKQKVTSGDRNTMKKHKP